MAILITILGAILAIFVVILIHEAGHFFVAKALGVRVLRFSIGFGKALWSYQSRHGTEYVLAVLPLGGYVRMLDDREVQVSQAEAKYAFNRQPLLSRMAIVLAGPFTNFLLAMVAFWGVYLLGVSYVKPVIGQVAPQSIAAKAGLQPGDFIQSINGEKTTEWGDVLTALVEQVGSTEPVSIITVSPRHPTPQTHDLDLQQWKVKGQQPDILESVGLTPFTPTIPAIVRKIAANSPAAHSGLQVGDRIIAFNNQPIADWQVLSKAIRDHANQEVTLTAQRGGVEQQLPVQISANEQGHQSVGYLGVEVQQPPWPPEMVENPKFSVMTAWQPAAKQTWDLIAFNFVVLSKMIHGKISVATLGGPITIFRTAGEASQQGLSVYLGFIGFISVALGFVNVLPIPGLDGGHLLFQVIEGVIRRPIPERYQTLMLKIGIILIILLILQGTINDVVRLF